MTCARHLGTALMGLALLTACDGAGRGASPTPTSPPAAVTGEITISSISPEPGATVPVRACTPGSEMFCADQPQVTIDVVVDRDIPNASLSVGFDRCGSASMPLASLTAGSRVSLTTSVIYLSDDGPLHDGVGARPFCELPAVTTKTIVGLRRAGDGNAALLTREFPNTYTFAKP